MVQDLLSEVKEAAARLPSELPQDIYQVREIILIKVVSELSIRLLGPVLSAGHLAQAWSHRSHLLWSEVRRNCLVDVGQDGLLVLTKFLEILRVL